MLLIKTVLKQSSIEGLGVFADQTIPKGTIVWRFEPRLDLLIDPDEVNKHPAAFAELCRRYAYFDKKVKKYVLCGDDARFINHCDNANTRGVYPAGEPQGLDIAARDIWPGEEITSNYQEFDAEFALKITLPAD